MLSILGRGPTLCDGLNRREILRAGGLSLFGLTLPGLLRAAEQNRGSGFERRPARAKSVILFNLLGGPSHMDMFDLKPGAPAEIRSEFQPIATSLPGLQICEHLPSTAKWMHKACLIRTISHTYNSHDPLDLEERGLLDSTLVIVMGEMGRSPRVNSSAGRDHWPQCGFSLLTGGGVKAGMVYGATDNQAAYPVSDPVHPSELVATIYHLLGIDPHMIVHDRLGRPFPIARGGDPILGVVS